MSDYGMQGYVRCRAHHFGRTGSWRDRRRTSCPTSRRLAHVSAYLLHRDLGAYPACRRDATSWKLQLKTSSSASVGLICGVRRTGIFAVVDTHERETWGQFSESM